jgi:hypothetical protein
MTTVAETAIAAGTAIRFARQLSTRTCLPKKPVTVDVPTIIRRMEILCYLDADPERHGRHGVLEILDAEGTVTRRYAVISKTGWAYLLKQLPKPNRRRPRTT